MPPEQTGERHPCEWCGMPSTERVVITPAVFTSAGGVRRLKVHATEVDVCAEHAAMVARNKAEAEAIEAARKLAAAQARAVRTGRRPR